MIQLRSYKGIIFSSFLLIDNVRGMKTSAYLSLNSLVRALCKDRDIFTMNNDNDTFMCNNTELLGEFETLEDLRDHYIELFI